jgi:hypothetical protein
MSQSVYVLTNGAQPREDLAVLAVLRSQSDLDPDGISSTPNYTFLWQRSAERTDNAGAWQTIAGATASSYTPGDGDVGYLLRAVLGYVDGAGNTESVTVVTGDFVANVNDRPTHNLRLVGSFVEKGLISVGPVVGSTDPARILDADNSAPITLDRVSYTWFADNELLPVEGPSLRLSQDEVGKRIDVRLSYTDGRGTDESISIGATSLVTNLNDSPTGEVVIDGSPVQGAQLQANNTLDDADGIPTAANAFSYAWLANGVAISGATQSTFTLTQSQVGKTISVRATYTDRFGAVESRESAATAAIENINDAPVGTVRVELGANAGTAASVAREDVPLRAVNAFSDLDGLPASFAVRWQASGSPANASDWVDIDGARGGSALFVPGDAEVGQHIRAVVRYTDLLKTDEEVVSAAIGPVQNVNDTAVGLVRVQGTPRQGDELSVSFEISDADGPTQVDSSRLSYQWMAGSSYIPGATGETFTPGQAQVGSAIRVRVSFLDDRGGAESLSSGLSSAVLNIDDQPVGSLRVLGTARQGDVLTADHSLLVDPDGPKSNIVITWLEDGQPIAGLGNISTLTLTQAQVDKRIAFSMRYSDGTNVQTVVSDETAAVLDQPDTPTGSVLITGSLTENASLTATAQIVDLDGVGDINWEWLSNGRIISGESAPTLELTQSLVGTRISARAVYRDGLGTSEFVTSAETAAVANVANPLEGGLTVDGVIEQGRTLRLRHDIADLDGIPVSGQPGALAFQWLSGGKPIQGATGLTFVPAQAQVGLSLGVQASYTDLHGGKGLSLLDLGVVENVNDAPAATLRIEGAPLVGATLRRVGSLSDPDGISEQGLAEARHQWLVGGLQVDSARPDALTLDRSMAGKPVALQISYTDALGADETVSLGVPMVSFSRLTGPVYHWRSHSLLPGAEVVIEGRGEPVAASRGALAGGDLRVGTGQFIPPSSGLDAAASSGLALRAAGFDAQGDLRAEVWLDPGGVFINEFSARLVASGPGAVQFTPVAEGLPDSWSSLTAISQPAGGGELLLQSGTTDTAESVNEARLLGVLRVHLNATANSTRIALAEADLGGSALEPYSLTLGRSLSNAQGRYGFDGLDFEALEVKARLPLSTADAAAARHAITPADALAALKLAAARNPNPAIADDSSSGTGLPSSGSPYQFIAADINRDGEVTADDARLIMAIAAGRPGALQPEWVLVREDQGYSTEADSPAGFVLNRNQASFDPDTVFTPGGANRGGWVAVLLGDVDGSWRPVDSSGDPLSGAPVLPAEYLAQLNADLGVSLGQFGVG